MKVKNTMSKQKIFVSAYACEPNQGSEIGVGWHWILEMSKYFELWVLTRKSNQHTIEPWIAEHPEYGKIQFIYFDLPKWARFWKKGLRGVRTYYNIWQFCTNRIVKKVMQENNIHIFHHLTYGNALWRVSSYGQKQFFIWGPIGGLESIPKEYSCCYDKKTQTVECLRRIVTSLAPYSLGFKQRCRQADLILCKTEITQKKVPQPYRHKSVLFTDVAADEVSTSEAYETNNSNVEFISVGRLDAWRGFDIIIEAMARSVRENSRIHLTIVGEGPDKKRLEKLVRQLQLTGVVTFAGKVSMESYKKLMRQSDVVINAALKEGAVTVSFDSMAMGKPLICIDTTGYTRYFTNEYAIVIPRTRRENVIDNMKDGIIRLTKSDERKSLGEKARIVSSQFSWKHHGEEIRDAIIKAYANYISSQDSH